MLKQNYVSEWWSERLEDGTQVVNAKSYRDRGMLVEVMADARWYSRIDTDVLYEEHMKWAMERGHYKYVESTSKTGFMLMFYKTTGASRTRTRIGVGKGTKYVASFRELRFHREWDLAERSAA